MRILKIILISIGTIVLLIFGLFFGGLFYFSWQDSRYYDIEIPEGKHYEKPVEYLSESELDSLKTQIVKTDKLEVIGTGYGGYDFYMWHKPTQKGFIYIKAFEITRNNRLSEKKLSTRTKNSITKLSDEFQIYEGRTVIDEGTFEKYYPTRFELWFKPFENGAEKKLTEKEYLIDGWDR